MSRNFTITDDQLINLSVLINSMVTDERNARESDIVALITEHEKLKTEVEELKRQIKVMNLFIGGISDAYQIIKQHAKEEPEKVGEFE